MRPEHTALVAIVQALWLGYAYLLVKGMDAAKSSEATERSEGSQ